MTKTNHKHANSPNSKNPPEFSSPKTRLHQGTPKNFYYSDGIELLAESYNLYWLISDISIVHRPCAIERYKAKLYYVFLEQLNTQEMSLTITSDNNSTAIYQHRYRHVNCDLEKLASEIGATNELKLLIHHINNHSYLMLPTEHQNGNNQHKKPNKT